MPVFEGRGVGEGQDARLEGVGWGRYVFGLRSASGIDQSRWNRFGKKASKSRPRRRVVVVSEVVVVLGDGIYLEWSSALMLNFGGVVRTS